MEEWSPQERAALRTPPGEDDKCRKGKSIQVVDNEEFAKRYKLGGIVMRSTHPAMEIKYATRYSDQQEFIVKLRYKPKCFRCTAEETDWRRGTDFMLNLPHHVGIATMLEVLEDSRAFYIVMERAPGMDLMELLHARKMFTVNEVREILYSILQSLAHLHAHHGIHKDLKLENVVVDTSGMPCIGTSGPWIPKSVKLIDFDTIEPWTPKSPPAKHVLGTDQYIAQEAYKGQYSPRSDIFAVGVIGYLLMIGRLPFKEDIFDDRPGENWVGSVKMEEIRGKLKQQKVKFHYRIFQQNPHATDLLASMLSSNEHARPTAKEAVEAKWMAERYSCAAAPVEEGPLLKIKQVNQLSCFAFLRAFAPL